MSDEGQNSILRGLVEEAGSEPWGEPDTEEQRQDRAETQAVMGEAQLESLTKRGSILRGFSIIPQLVRVGTTKGTSTTFPPAHVVEQKSYRAKTKVLCRKMPIWLGSPWITTIDTPDMCERCRKRLEAMS